MQSSGRRWTLPFRRVTRSPTTADFLPRVLHVVDVTAAASAALFLVVDGFQPFDLSRALYSSGMLIVFGALAWLTRQGLHFRIALHLTTVAIMGFFVWNFFFDAGAHGPTLIAFLVVNVFVAILHRTRSSLIYVTAGLVAIGTCLVLQAFQPGWITPYASRERWFFDVGLSYLICVVMVFAVMRMFVRLLSEAGEREKQALANLGQTQKLAVLGDLLSSITDRAQRHLDVVSGYLAQSGFWWHQGIPRVRSLMGRLTPAQSAAFWVVLDQGLNSPMEESGHVRKVLFDELAVRLEQHEFADPLGLAERMTRANLTSWNPRWQALLGSDLGREAFLFLVEALTVESENRASQLSHAYLTSLMETVTEYSRLVTGDQGPAPLHLERGLELVLELFAPRSARLEVVRQFRPVPPVFARSGSLVQAWTLLVQGALEAMEGTGTLTASLDYRGDKVTISFFYTDFRDLDAGPPLTLEAPRQILAVSQGTLSFQKLPGRGLFEVSLPAWFSN